MSHDSDQRFPFHEEQRLRKSLQKALRCQLLLNSNTDLDENKFSDDIEQMRDKLTVEEYDDDDGDANDEETIDPGSTNADLRQRVDRRQRVGVRALLMRLCIGLCLLQSTFLLTDSVIHHVLIFLSTLGRSVN